MKKLIKLADRGLLPDGVIRFGIRQLDKKRLRDAARENAEQPDPSLERLIGRMRQSPIAILPQKANEQHYEVPSAFFRRVLGRHLKYSSCYWPRGVNSLDQAEAAMLTLTCERAEIADGQQMHRVAGVPLSAAKITAELIAKILKTIGVTSLTVDRSVQ